MSDEFTTDGDQINEYLVALPTGTLEAPQAYPHGTLMTLKLQVRVKSVRLEEDRKGNLNRKHILGLDHCEIEEVLTPAARQALLEATLVDTDA